MTKKEAAKAIRECPGIAWLGRYGKYTREQRKAFLEPILRETEDKQTRKAIQAMIEHGRNLASDRKIWFRLLNWERYKRRMSGYMKEYRASNTLADSLTTTVV